MAKLRKYHVTGAVTISVYCEVHAKSAREAKRLALELPLGSIHHDTHQDPVDDDSGDWTEWRTTGELDGEVTELRAEAGDDEIDMGDDDEGGV